MHKFIRYWKRSVYDFWEGKLGVSEAYLGKFEHVCPTENMEVVIVCTLRHFEFNIPNVDIQIRDIKLIKPEPELNSTIFTEALKKAIGSIMLDYFVDRPYFVQNTIVPDDDINRQMILQAVFNDFINSITFAINYLWFSKDNCASAPNYYAIGYYTEDGRKKASVIGRNSDVGNTSAKATYETTIFNLQDFDISTKILNLVQRHIVTGRNAKLTEFQLGEFNISIPSYNLGNQTTTNTIERCLHYWDSARNEQFLPLKIALYMSVLETQFFR